MFEGLDLKGELLCEAVIYVDSETTPGPIGPAPWGNRMIAYIKNGEFSGPKMKGKVLPGGGDWINLASGRPNAMKVDVRAVWETDDGAKLYLSYTGRIINPENEESDSSEEASSLDSSEYYFRVSPTFETSHPKYLWLNDIVCVGVGKQVEGGVAYRMYQIT